MHSKKFINELPKSKIFQNEKCQNNGIWDHWHQHCCIFWKGYFFFCFFILLLHVNRLSVVVVWVIFLGHVTHYHESWLDYHNYKGRFEKLFELILTCILKCDWIWKTSHLGTLWYSNESDLKYSIQHYNLPVLDNSHTRFTLETAWQ